MKDYPGLKCVLPFKRKSLGRGKVGVKAESLLEAQEAFNRAFVSEWVVSEYSNGRVKKFQVWVVSLEIGLNTTVL